MWIHLFLILRHAWRDLAALSPQFAQYINQDTAAALEAIHIHCPSLNGVVLDNLVGPLAELHGAFVFNLETDSDYSGI